MGHHQMSVGVMDGEPGEQKAEQLLKKYPKPPSLMKTISLYFREPETSVCESSIAEVYRAIDTTVMFIAALFTKPEGEYNPNVQSQRR